MKILYDHQIFSKQKYGGISKYFCEIMKNIVPENEFNLSLVFSDNQYLKEDYPFFKKTILPIPEKQFKGKSFLKRKIYILNKLYSKSAVSSNKFDLFHPTFFDDYFLYSLKKPYILTVHDLTMFKFKDLFFWRGENLHQIEKVIKNASRIISISHNTKNDLIEMLHIPPGKIDVIHHGFNKPSVDNTVNRFGKYILFVGSRERYKNFTTFIRAICVLLNKERDLKLVCVGPPFNKEELAELRKLKIIEYTVILTVDEKTLNSLYANALIFVYPSLYEGFGMPILEAFANNCPVCLSNTSCFPEIAGKAGIYFDPYNSESILEAVTKVLFDNNLKTQMVKAGNERLVDFSWKKAAKETIASYKKTLQEE